MKILLIGPDFLHYVKSVETALKLLNHEVITYNLPVYLDAEKNYFFRRIYKLGIKSFGDKYYQKINDNFLADCKNLNPDICLNLDGNIINADTIKKMQELNIKVIVWIMDSLQKKSYKTHLGKLHLFNKIFSFEPSDIQYVKNKFNIEAVYLPMGYDGSIFNRIDKNEKIFDIAFIGAKSALRKKLLNAVAKYSFENNRKLEIIMPLWTKRNVFHKIRNIWHEIIFKNKFPYLSNTVKNTTVNAKEAAILYNQSKICVNIHTELHTGLNPRGFEIMGCGSFHLVDKNAESLLTKQEHVAIFQNEIDLINKIDYYLKNDKEREDIAEKGFIYVKNKFTVKKCLEKMFAQI